MAKNRKKGNPQKRGPNKTSQKTSQPTRMTYAGISIEMPQEHQLLTIVDGTGLHAIQKVQKQEAEIKQLRQEVADIQPVESIPAEVTATLVSIATNAWRAKNKMVDAETGEPKDDMRRVFRHIDGIFNAFNELGLRIIDPTGKVYDTGMALKAISFEPTAGLSREEVTETIKPSIIWQDRLLQIGEVIVGTPIDEHTTEKEQTNE